MVRYSFTLDLEKKKKKKFLDIEQHIYKLKILRHGPRLVKTLFRYEHTLRYKFKVTERIVMSRLVTKEEDSSTTCVDKKMNKRCLGRKLFDKSPTDGCFGSLRHKWNRPI